MPVVKKPQAEAGKVLMRFAVAEIQTYIQTMLLHILHNFCEYI
jgi:hypothetical protein